MPYDNNEFRKEFDSKGKSKRTFIYKPEADCQGRGIFLSKTYQHIERSSDDHQVVQRYIDKPMLIDGLKFDFRIYVLLYGVDPLRIYLFKEGLARFATEPYEKPTSKNVDNLYVPLPNYSINKLNENFVFNENEEEDDTGHKRSMTSVLRQLAQEGHDVTLLMNRICDMIVKTIITAQPNLSHMYRTCQPDDNENQMAFEVLGFDVMLDEKCRPWLLEINHAPSFATDTPLDYKIKKNLIYDTI